MPSIVRTGPVLATAWMDLEHKILPSNFRDFALKCACRCAVEAVRARV